MLSQSSKAFFLIFSFISTALAKFLNFFIFLYILVNLTNKLCLNIRTSIHFLLYALPLKHICHLYKKFGKKKLIGYSYVSYSYSIKIVRSSKFFHIIDSERKRICLKCIKNIYYLLLPFPIKAFNKFFCLF